jgi:hypothetical protein
MVYVDESIWPYGRMMMCHMVADSRAELDEMADKIKVPRKWIQHAGTDREHYDICKSKRALAVAAGAKEVTAFELVSIVRLDGRPVR